MRWFKESNVVLKVAMVQKSLTGRRMAQLTGISANTISQLQSGRFRPTREEAEAIAEVLNVSIDELFS